MDEANLKGALKRLGELHSAIWKMQDQFNRKEIGGYDKAATLQSFRNEAAELIRALKPYGARLAYEHPFPDLLPPALKRTRNEVRVIIGLPPIEESES